MSAIDDYLASVPKPQKTELERVRKIIKSALPDAEEAISYGMPVFKVNNTYIIGVAAFKNHMSIFPGPEAIETLKDTLVSYKTAKGTIQFTPEHPLLDSIITEIVHVRLDAIAKQSV